MLCDTKFEMVKTCLVFVPNNFQTQKLGHIEGFYKEFEECEVYYVTNKIPPRETLHKIGQVSNGTPKSHTNGLFFDNYSHKWEVISRNASINFVKIDYDYEALCWSDNIQSTDLYDVHFTFLLNTLKDKHKKNSNGRQPLYLQIITIFAVLITKLLTILSYGKIVWQYSATFTNFYENLQTWQWIFNQIKAKRFTPKVGNLIASKCIDLALGLIFLRLFLEYEEMLLEMVGITREDIINNCRELLTYLMGSPIGLKLNYAFNNSLGRFFFYHIWLWRVFLITMEPFIKDNFKLLVLPGVCGFSYQMAMVSDIISIATFHVYCIYVYAARLLHLQLRGLWSLWRLFIGRKYNPLREWVDSFQYTQHQLFIGTLGFTVLFFLLPTTVMYYSVFLIFRLVIIIAQEVLKIIRYVLHCLPIYVVLLWIFQSSHLAGSIYLKMKKSKEGLLHFDARLKMLPLGFIVKDCALTALSWNLEMSWKKIFTGVLI